MDSELKRCAKCRKVKPETEFTRNRKTKDGFEIGCKDCRPKPKKREYYHPSDLVAKQRILREKLGLA